jgi:hypothetical protein
MNPTAQRISLATLLAAFLPGCAGAGSHSPSLDVLGSYFPAWMLCIIVGLVLSLITRLVLVAFRLDAHLRPAPVVYPCLAVIFTMAVWLAFFRN